jgi:tape measure domain-containing protein
MSTISSTLALNDSMTPVLRSIISALEGVNATLDRLDATMSRAFDPQAVAAATRAVRQTDAAQETLTESVRETERVQDELTDSVRATERAQDNVTNSMRESSHAAGDLWGKIKGFVAAYAGWELVRSTVAWSDEMSNIQARLAQVNDGSRTQEQLMRDIYLNAQDAHASLQGMADIVGRFGNNARDAFKSNDELLAFSNQLYKMFSIAGTDQNGAAAAMLQLSQGLGAGVLRGEELNSVFEQAPIIIQTIANYLNVPIGKIREMAQEGKLTADVVKNALLSAADETNAKFAAMPLTFSAAWTMAKNTFQMQMMNLQKVISGLINTAQFQEILDSFTNALSSLASFAIPLIKGAAAAVGWLYRNWSLIAPVVYSVVAAMAIYKGVLIAQNIVEGVSKGLKMASVLASFAKAAATGTEVAATTAATAAQWGWNTSMYMCPITWIVLAIIALVGVLYLGVAAINKIAGTTISATGIIVGACKTAAAFSWNLMLGVWNGFLSILDAIVEPVIGIIDWCYTAFTGGFDNIGDACLNILGQVVSAALAVILPILEVWDYVSGTDSVEAIHRAQAAARDWGKNEEGRKKSIQSNVFTRTLGADKDKFRKTYSGAWNSGYDQGAAFADNPMGALQDAMGIKLDPAIQSILDEQKVGNNLAGQIAENTTPKAEEDYKYLKDIMAGQAVDRLSGADIRIQMNNNNKINSALDLDSIVNALALKLTGAMDSAAEGVHP